MELKAYKTEKNLKTLLIVEDDEFFRTALKAMLAKSGYEILEAPNGMVAKNIITAVASLDLIISDVQMPHCDGIDLLDWLNRNRPTPFILMTGFGHILETQTAYNLGAKGFISKPFGPDEIIKEIKTALGEDKKPLSLVPDELLQQSFCKVSIDEFVTNKSLNFDIYVQLSEKKFIKIGHKGTEIPVERIDSYKARGLRFLYIKKEEFNKLVRFSLDLSKVVNKSSQVPRDKKLSFMRYTGEVILEKAFMEGVDPDSFNDARDFISASVEVIGDDNVCFDLLNHLNSHSDYLYAHGLCVSMYSIMIARKMGITQSQTFFKLSMAGLFHDIGKKEIDAEILAKPRIMLTAQERKMIESHPTRGKELLSQLPHIPFDIIQMVYEHHEDCIGQGYPRGIKKNEIHPLSRILCVANVFAEYAIKSPSQPGMSGTQAVEQMKIHHAERLDPEAFAAIKAIFRAK